MKIEIYVSNVCPYCVKAKALLKKKGVTWVEYNIQEDASNIPEMLKRSGGKKSVPQIFINDQHIGGCDDLYALDSKGKLDTMLK